MQLIGMLDSPYVRRVAIALQLLGLPFTHRSLSVFRTYDEFRRINPVVKAPTLICDDGTILMDSGLIIDYAQHLPGVRRPLLPSEPAARAKTLHALGLALAACEKSVQLVYECQLRPSERQHAPWIARVTEQLDAALQLLDEAIARRPLAVAEDTIDQAGIATATTWRFARAMTPDAAPNGRFPAIEAFCAQAETLRPFLAAPHGAGTFTAS